MRETGCFKAQGMELVKIGLDRACEERETESELERERGRRVIRNAE